MTVAGAGIAVGSIWSYRTLKAADVRYHNDRVEALREKKREAVVEIMREVTVWAGVLATVHEAYLNMSVVLDSKELQEGYREFMKTTREKYIATSADLGRTIQAAQLLLTEKSMLDQIDVIDKRLEDSIEVIVGRLTQPEVKDRRPTPEDLASFEKIAEDVDKATENLWTQAVELLGPASQLAN
ncbi:hypothetical protein D1O33_00455 [Rhodococcus rhodochrous]|nr:hypothetical protein D1O33_00455 [Rhodococcus rhodochrous]